MQRIALGWQYRPHPFRLFQSLPKVWRQMGMNATGAAVVIGRPKDDPADPVDKYGGKAHETRFQGCVKAHLIRRFPQISWNGTALIFISYRFRCRMARSKQNG